MNRCLRSTSNTNLLGAALRQLGPTFVLRWIIMSTSTSVPLSPLEHPSGTQLLATPPLTLSHVLGTSFHVLSFSCLTSFPILLSTLSHFSVISSFLCTFSSLSITSSLLTPTSPLISTRSSPHLAFSFDTLLRLSHFFHSMNFPFPM